jgi:hypothetical protein
MKYSIQEINRFLKIYPIELQEIIVELRDLVFKSAPDAHERFLRGGLTYLKVEGGGPVKDGICNIYVRDDAVRVVFIHGSFLPDPAKILKKEGERKYMRYVEIKALEEANWPALEGLMRASAAFDPRSVTGTQSS